MARLSKDQWTEMRCEWEASGRQGLTWLTRAGGGPWEVTEEAIRRKRLAEHWQKPRRLAELARHARAEADTLSALRIASDGYGLPPPNAAADDHGRATQNGGESPEGGWDQETSAEATKDADAARVARAAALLAASDEAAHEMRTRLLYRHRAEWNDARKVVYAAMKVGNNPEATAAERSAAWQQARLGKIATESLRNIQEGERKAWSLDAEMIDFDSLTDAQLHSVANGRLPR